MNESLIKDIANEQMPVSTAIRGFINTTNYINIGVITKVHNKNYVDVSLYYTDNTGKKVQVQAVRLLHIGTTKCKLLITPAIGDNVLLLSTKDFIEKIEYNRQPQRSDNSYLPYGNINMCGILIKDESDDNVKTTITITENGDITLNTKGDVEVSSDKKISFDGKKYGGLCKTQELKTQLDKATARIDGIIDALEKSATGTQDGGATYKANITLALQKLTDKENYSNIESDKVMHGDNSKERS